MADNLDYAINSITFRSDSLDVFEILDPSFRQYFDNNNAQVQIIDRDGMVIFDSLGVLYTEEIIYPDIIEAKNNNRGVWQGKVDYSDEKVMAMSTPIINSTNQNIGILRMVISLDQLERFITSYTAIFIGIGISIVLLALIISNYLAKSIVTPLRNLKDVALRLADGQLDVRGEVDTNDEIETLSDSINYMADELEKRDQVKNDFISSVSHELRTPLTSIKGWALTIINMKDSENSLTDEGLEIIVNETERLSEMVEELLDFSRFTSGKITLKKETIDVKIFITEVVKQMMPRVIRDNHVFVLDLGEDLGSMTVDRDRLRQVFINIFDNAIKFTEEPGMIAFYGRRNAHGELMFTIRDTGAGISADDIKNVKEKFYKGNLGQSHTGLGLSISDKIVKLHKGQLDIESELGKGTAVKIVFPAENLGDEV